MVQVCSAPKRRYFAEKRNDRTVTPTVNAVGGRLCMGDLFEIYFRIGLCFVDLAMVPKQVWDTVPRPPVAGAVFGISRLSAQVWLAALVSRLRERLDVALLLGELDCGGVVVPDARNVQHGEMCSGHMAGREMIRRNSNASVKLVRGYFAAGEGWRRLCDGDELWDDKRPYWQGEVRLGFSGSETEHLNNSKELTSATEYGPSRFILNLWSVFDADVSIDVTSRVFESSSLRVVKKPQYTGYLRP
ncbi:hypothetical protein CONLIGDRAFT_648396 [Coniochaeta ligniaria NRRL 30616]|uniref:Uncharacterized protein n=1 Tax=Coniochaeta ligniaria NRRL 30616 TaxID=1408157 RepID=A0A1J7IDJ6_9PEZI|nr:hypothetical protein CONLIGDRAFT_648396 [Coniochaeta ligniaria NRRL 30616]